MLFSPHHGDPKQAGLMSDLRIMIKAGGQSSILSKCCITSKYYNRRGPQGLDQRQGSFVLARTYHAIIPRRSAAGLCLTAIPNTPGPSSHPHAWEMDHFLPPLKEVSRGLRVYSGACS